MINVQRSTALLAVSILLCALLAARLELELERDRRERDAREREMRERELREMELREKVKAEMDLKPSGGCDIIVASFLSPWCWRGT